MGANYNTGVEPHLAQPSQEAGGDRTQHPPAPQRWGTNPQGRVLVKQGQRCEGDTGRGVTGRARGARGSGLRGVPRGCSSPRGHFEIALSWCAAHSPRGWGLHLLKTPGRVPTAGSTGTALAAPLLPTARAPPEPGGRALAARRPGGAGERFLPIQELAASPAGRSRLPAAHPLRHRQPPARCQRPGRPSSAYPSAGRARAPWLSLPVPRALFRLERLRRAGSRRRWSRVPARPLELGSPRTSRWAQSRGCSQCSPRNVGKPTGRPRLPRDGAEKSGMGPKRGF